MKPLVTVSVIALLLAVLVTTAAASEVIDARVFAMGGVRAGLANGASAFLDNPAGLPDVNTFGPRLSPWPVIVSGTTSLDADVDVWSVLGAVHNTARTQGVGGGIWHASGAGSDTDFFGAGYGFDLWGPATSLGVSVVRQDGNGSATVFNVGVMQRIEDPINTWRIGLVARDVTDEWGNGPTFDLGASVDLPGGLLVAADLVDLTDEVDSRVNLGAQWNLPLTSLILRAGSADGDLTAGVGYRIGGLEISGAWADFDGGDEFQVSATGCF